jgi:F-type H+-transporting ATPase subunit b
MDSTLNALGGILLKAVPTFVLVILLLFYLKKVFFQPMEKILHRRYEATEGARKLAEQSLQRATARTAEYEAAIRAARSEVYQAQERLFKQLQESESAQIAAARHTADTAIRGAKDQLARDVEEAKATLSRETESLATQIAENILKLRGTAA